MLQQTRNIQKKIDKILELLKEIKADVNQDESFTVTVRDLKKILDLNFV